MFVSQVIISFIMFGALLALTLERKDTTDEYKPINNINSNVQYGTIPKQLESFDHPFAPKVNNSNKFLKIAFLMSFIGMLFLGYQYYKEKKVTSISKASISDRSYSYSERGKSRR